MSSLDLLVAKARERLLRMHKESGVGHLGGNLSCIDALVVLFNESMNEGDEFVLSKGHSAGALYVALWSTGTIDDAELLTFHGEDTRLPGHPPVGKLPCVTFATGSLGHGLSISAGVALGKRLRGDDGVTYCLTSDGEWQEGSTMEALVFASNQKINLHILVDANGWQGFAPVAEVQPSFSIESFASQLGVKVNLVSGHSVGDLRSALGDRDGVILTLMNTVKAKGYAPLEDTLESHYLPPSHEEQPQ